MEGGKKPTSFAANRLASTENRGQLMVLFYQSLSGISVSIVGDLKGLWSILER